MAGWPGYAGNAQHTALSAVASQALTTVQWNLPVDLNPVLQNNDLLIHYGTPIFTPSNTIIVPVKTGTTDGFRVEGVRASTGDVLWSQASDYTLPAHNWVPSFSPTLTPANRLYFPAAGGTVEYIDNPGSPNATIGGRISVLGSYNAALDYNNIWINTPITSDSAGDIYFGYTASSSARNGLVSGLARIAANGTASWVAAPTMANDSTIVQVQMNCAPALSNDGQHVYVAVATLTGSAGYLVELNSTTLAPEARVLLIDPTTNTPGSITNDSSASPTIGPDGDVYFGILEHTFASNHDRGFLLHFNNNLSQSKIPGLFGWDDTVSIVPSSMVPSYSGTSSYLVMAKYNNYVSVGTGPTYGDGVNKIAVLDPNATQPDPLMPSVLVMKEVLTKAGVTPDAGWVATYPNAVREWCINTAVVDPATKSVIVNSEDGILYRWDLTTNTFTQHVVLTAGLGQAYTPTVIGPDGASYAISDARLYRVGAAQPSVTPIADQNATPSTPITVTIAATDPNGLPLTYGAQADSLLYGLKQSYGLYQDPGGYLYNQRGMGEKYVRGVRSASGYNDPNGYWYYILPNGDLYEFTPPYASSTLTGALVARLGTAVYSFPTQLLDPPNLGAPISISISGNQLTFTPNAGSLGTYVIVVTASDSLGAGIRGFKVILPSAQSPTLSPIAEQSIAPAASAVVTLSGADPANLPLTYSAVALPLNYWLNQTYMFYQDPNGYYLNARGQNERYVRAVKSASGYTDPNGYWYYILPNGDLYEFTPPYYNNSLVGAFVAHLGTDTYYNPLRLWNAPYENVLTTLAVSGNQLTITPNPTYSGRFEVVATVSNSGQMTASRSFVVNAGFIQPPTLASIPDQTITTAPSVTVTLVGSDANNLPLTYSAQAQTLPYWLNQTYKFSQDPNGYYLNYRGQNERYVRAMKSANGYNDPSGYWYYILPNGDLYEFTPSYSNPTLVGVLVGRLGTAVYNDPSLLWNAANSPAPTTLGISGNQLTVTPNAGFTGTFVVIATVTNTNQASASQAFKVNVIVQPPTLASIPDQTIPNGTSKTITLVGSDPNNKPLTYSATGLTLTYWLNQTYRFSQDPNGYYLNYRGQNERYLHGAISANGYNSPTTYFWYYILPNGDLYEFTPPYTNSSLVGALVAHLGTAVYNNPALLWNAANTAVPATLGVAGNQLTISPNSGASGTFVVIATVTNSTGSSASRTFNVMIS